MVFENGVKNIQAPAYNGARTVFILVIKSSFIHNVILEPKAEYQRWTLKAIY